MKPIDESDQTWPGLPREGDRPKIISLTTQVDERGWLVEGTHSYDLPPTVMPVGSRWASLDLSVPPRFGQVYLVHSRVRGTVRGFHRHRILYDAFQLAAGSAKFVVWSGIVAGDGKSAVVGDLIEVVLTLEAPKLLIVPSLWYHGWVALEDRTTVVSVGTELYNPVNPDEQRVPFDILGDAVWTVKNR